jgi:hypothetical protein
MSDGVPVPAVFELKDVKTYSCNGARVIRATVNVPSGDKLFVNAYNLTDVSHVSKLLENLQKVRANNDPSTYYEQPLSGYNFDVDLSGKPCNNKHWLVAAWLKQVEGMSTIDHLDTKIIYHAPRASDCSFPRIIDRRRARGCNLINGGSALARRVAVVLHVAR